MLFCLFVFFLEGGGDLHSATCPLPSASGLDLDNFTGSNIQIFSQANECVA